MEEIHRISTSNEPDLTVSWKTGVRVLGVSESFKKDQERSVVVGVVMRGDLRIDGFGLCRPRVGGMDATEQLISMYRRMQRGDIRAWILGGGVISWFNIVDLESLFQETDIPVVCVSYEDSEGLEKYIKEYFPDDCEERLAALRKAGERESVLLGTGHSVFLLASGMGANRAKRLVNLFTLDGKVPEPVRVARTLAAAVQRDMET
ncbi:DUF99 family protein [Candidatus Thorarchaeota archaeon]|nr:MAG: DUF99 family protein [Candidatus Thorarchaeota archaeon]